MKILDVRRPKSLYAAAVVVAFSVDDLRLLELIERQMPSGHAHSRERDRDFKRAGKLLAKILDAKIP